MVAQPWWGYACCESVPHNQLYLLMALYGDKTQQRLMPQSHKHLYD